MKDEEDRVGTGVGGTDGGVEEEPGRAAEAKEGAGVEDMAPFIAPGRITVEEATINATEARTWSGCPRRDPRQRMRRCEPLRRTHALPSRL